MTQVDKLNRTRYRFNNDSWWDDPGCDCCEGTLMDCYNIDTNLHPEMVQNGTSHSIEDCMIDVLDHHCIIDAQSDWREEYGIGRWEEEWEWLLNTMQENGLQVEIEGEGVFP